MGRYEALPADRLLSYLPAFLGFATLEGDAWQRERGHSWSQFGTLFSKPSAVRIMAAFSPLSACAETISKFQTGAGGVAEGVM